MSEKLKERPCFAEELCPEAFPDDMDPALKKYLQEVAERIKDQNVPPLANISPVNYSRRIIPVPFSGLHKGGMSDIRKWNLLPQDGRTAGNLYPLCRPKQLVFAALLAVKSGKFGDLHPETQKTVQTPEVYCPKLKNALGSSCLGLYTNEPTPRPKSPRVRNQQTKTTPEENSSTTAVGAKLDGINHIYFKKDVLELLKDRRIEDLISKLTNLPNSVEITHNNLSYFADHPEVLVVKYFGNLYLESDLNRASKVTGSTLFYDIDQPVQISAAKRIGVRLARQHSASVVEAVKKVKDAGNLLFLTEQLNEQLHNPTITQILKQTFAARRAKGKRF